MSPPGPLAGQASGWVVVSSVGTGPTVSPGRPGHLLAPGGVSPQSGVLRAQAVQDDAQTGF